MKIVIIDNYDSFTYNLSHLVKELGAEVTVMRNDSFKLEELKVFDKIILSLIQGKNLFSVYVWESRPSERYSEPN